MNTTDVTAAVIRRNGKILICGRLSKKIESERWEFPGGKREPGETLAECLKREIREELGTEVIVLDLLGENTVSLADRQYHLHFFRTLIKPGGNEPAPLEGQSMKWIPTAELSHCDILPGDLDIAHFLEKAALFS